VVQLYIRDMESPQAPSNPVLCGFQRIHLEEGEEKLLNIPIDPKAFTVIDEAGQRIGGSGKWQLFAGLGQPDSRTEELTGKKCLSVEL